MQSKRICIVAAFCFSAAGCTPPWSIRLPAVAGPQVKHIRVVDQRPNNEREFRFVDFAKLSYKSYLGDTNTTPNRIAYLQSRIDEQASPLPEGTTVEVRHFDVLQDLSGSACKGCALAAASYTAAIIAESGRKAGDDSFTCSIAASLGGTEVTAEVSTFFRMGPFDSVHSENVIDALGKCMSSAADAWLDRAAASIH